MKKNQALLIGHVCVKVSTQTAFTSADPKSTKRQPTHQKKKVDQLVVLFYFSRFALYAVRLKFDEIDPSRSTKVSFVLSKKKDIKFHVPFLFSMKKQFDVETLLQTRPIKSLHKIKSSFN